MRLKQFIESNRFDWFITVLIAINAIVLGLETVPEVATRFGSTLRAIDFFLLLIFTVELISRFIVYRQRFFHDPWRCFDFVLWLGYKPIVALLVYKHSTTQQIYSYDHLPIFCSTVTFPTFPCTMNLRNWDA